VLESQVDRNALHKLLVLIQHLYVVFFLHVPDEDAFVHPRRHQEPRVNGPTQVQHVLSVTHQPTLGRPPEYLLGPVDRQTVLPFLPNGDALIVRTRSQEGAVGRVTHHVGVFVGLRQAVEDAQVPVVGVQGTAIRQHLPNLDAALGALPLLLEELLVVGTGRSKLVGEGMEIDGQDAVLESVPANVRRVNAHNLAVDYIIVQRSTPRSLQPLIHTLPAFFAQNLTFLKTLKDKKRCETHLYGMWSIQRASLLLFRRFGDGNIFLCMS
jgi:hypothetical protein